MGRFVKGGECVNKREIIIIYHQTDVIYINTSRYNICCYQKIDTTTLEFTHYLVTL